MPKQHGHEVPQHPPPWWPADEPWPPAGPSWRWRRLRGRFLWRVALLLALLFLLVPIAFGFLGFLGWLAMGKFGGGPPFGNAPIDGRPHFLGPFGFFFFVLVVIGVIAAVRALRGVTTPVGNVIEAAGRVAEGNYAVRVDEQGPPEVQALARAFNQMASRVQTHEEQRRSLLADITHELRTPLAVIQGNLEGLLDGVYPRDDAHLAPVLEETRVLSTLIEDLRTLALAETGALELQREPTDLTELMEDAVASFRLRAEAAGVTIGAEFEAGLPTLDIDPTRIRQVLVNLLTNALQHTRAGGSIRVRCARELNDGVDSVSVVISDTGRGIAPEELPRVFDRFYKSPDSRGSGLGLAIVKNLVTAHGGVISASSEPGKGTTIRFTLPVSA